MSAVPLASTSVAVLLALVTQERPSVRSVAAAVDRSIGVVHKHLHRLRDLELVAWEDYLAGTLRPLVRVVAAEGSPTSAGPPSALLVGAQRQMAGADPAGVGSRAR